MDQKSTFFSNLVVRNYVTHINYTDCVATLMAAVADALLKFELSNKVTIYLIFFCKRHRNDATLVGVDTWDLDIVHCVITEFLFFTRYIDIVFNFLTDRYTAHDSFSY